MIASCKGTPLGFTTHRDGGPVPVPQSADADPPLQSCSQCDDHAWCTADVDTVTCLCFAGFHGDGRTCTAGDDAGHVERFRQVSAGDHHTCALRPDGTVTCWDYNRGSQSTQSGTFGQISATGAYELVPYEAHGGAECTCGLRRDGTIACWEQADCVYVQPIPQGAFKQVATGNIHACAVRPSGSVECWGYGFSGETRAPTGSFRQISSGSQHTCGVRDDNTVACWGRNDYGESSPPSGGFRQVVSGTEHSCGIRMDGTITCWGRGDQGQSTPPAGSFVQLSAGNALTCGISANSAVACWGNADHGEDQAPSGTFHEVAVGGQHACGLRVDGTLTCWGNTTNRTSPLGRR